jgi:hypothetical protein
MKFQNMGTASVCNCGDHGFAPLRMATVVFFDAEETPNLVNARWHLLKSRTCKRYATTVRSPDSVLMHRMLVGAKPGQFVGHVNGDGLDNRKSNLRLCSHSQNMANRRKSKSAKHSSYLGVYLTKGRWTAELKKAGKKHRRYCPSEAEAAKSYNEMAMLFHGDFARLNVIGA